MHIKTCWSFAVLEVGQGVVDDDDDEIAYFTVRWKTRELVLSTAPSRGRAAIFWFWSRLLDILGVYVHRVL